ncbi:hypothetical protein I4U23_016815 [Adineta vaga]|nr:hypothetical protein I4U23_016815 [Adineta vaga]
MNSDELYRQIASITDQIGEQNSAIERIGDQLSTKESELTNFDLTSAERNRIEGEITSLKQEKNNRIMAKERLEQQRNQLEAVVDEVDGENLCYSLVNNHKQ